MSLLTVLGTIFIIWGVHTIKTGKASFNNRLLSFEKNIEYTADRHPLQFWASVLIRLAAGVMMIYIDVT